MTLDPLYKLGPLENREDSLVEAKCMEHFPSRIPTFPVQTQMFLCRLAVASHCVTQCSPVLHLYEHTIGIS